MICKFTGTIFFLLAATQANAQSYNSTTALPVYSVDVGQKTTKVVFSMNDIGTIIKPYGKPIESYKLVPQISDLAAGDNSISLIIIMMPNVISPMPAPGSSTGIQSPLQTLGCNQLLDGTAASGQLCAVIVKHQIGNDNDQAPPLPVAAPTHFKFDFWTKPPAPISQHPAP